MSLARESRNDLRYVAYGNTLLSLSLTAMTKRIRLIFFYLARSHSAYISVYLPLALFMYLLIISSQASILFVIMTEVLNWSVFASTTFWNII